MKFLNDNGVITIILQGRIDSTNAPKIEEEIWQNVDFSTCKSIAIDAEQLNMISSAGLRIILRMKKQCADLLVKDVNPDVYEVFEMTGFSEMMKIEKAFRKLNVEGCEILGEGSNGIVYRYDPEIVVKVYRNKDALPEIKRERNLARKALVLGIPTAIPFDVVKVEDKYGSVFELLNAKSFSKLISEEDEKTDYYLGLFVDLLKRIHATEVGEGEFEDIKKTAINWANYLKDYLPKEQSDKLISLIENVPSSRHMIHGDFHTNNVEMQNGEVLLIDMDTLSFGHPIFEFGSMFLAFKGFGELDPTVTEKFLKIPYQKALYIWDKVFALYFNTDDPKVIKNIQDKAMVIGYTRLLRRTIKRIGFEDENGKKMIDNCKAKLADLLARIDSLEINK